MAPKAQRATKLIQYIPTGYEELAKELQVPDTTSKQAEINKFLHFLDSNGIKVYDKQKVYDFCNRSIGAYSRAYMREWSLRSVDYPPPSRYNVYNGVLPIEVLRTTRTISRGYPTAKFRVWDYELHRVADPFLVVDILGQLFVVYHWDEPGFTG